MFSIYFNYQERYKSDIKEERNDLLILVFRYVKNLIMIEDRDPDVRDIKEKILKIEDEEKRKDCLSKIDYIEECINKYFYGIEKLIDLKYRDRPFNYAEMEVDLLLYCILVSGLNKTKGERFDYIKKRLKPLTKKLREKFCEFDKHEIHKKRTFIFALRSPLGFDDDFYTHNYKDELLRKYCDEYYGDYKKEEISVMYLSSDKHTPLPPMMLRPNEILKFFEINEKNKRIEDYYLDAGKEKIKLV